MPELISRQQAIAKLEKEIPPGECLLCHIGKEHNYILHKGKYSTVLLSEYPRCWGQIMVMINRHVISFTELKTDEWTELLTNVQKATLCAEAVLKPFRCYVAATGSADNLLMTTPHIHFNIIPVYNKQDKPS
ncbi:MAG TPA: HIT domain-containing protein, partial [Bacteroidia bacterium]|nr:HIT domain-containing protein [Bacteroidia bacterium]